MVKAVAVSNAPVVVKEFMPTQLRFQNLTGDPTVNFQHAHLTDVGGKEIVFTAVDFSYSVITRAYFHKAKFENCKFTGARFTDCNFRGATFSNCDFRYADFNGTRVGTKEILRSLPDEPNLRRELLQILRKNALSMGDVHSARAFVLAEIDAKREHLRLAWRAEGRYYGKYASLRERANVLFQRIALALDSFLWGHGERLWKMAISVSALLVFSAILSLIFTTDSLGSLTISSALSIFANALNYYMSLFLDVQTTAHVKSIVWLDWAIVISRYVAFGVLIAGLFRWLSHR